MTIADEAFKAIPKNSTNFLIWRIEKLKLVQVPKDSYGSFYTGDSYIVFTATDGKEKVDYQMKPKEVRPEMLEVHIHFWLGEKTSQDEAGVAAYKTVELDDYFGGAPVQHREVQGHESAKFLSYFRNGLRLLDGGAASGFNHVEKVNKARLFHIKGKRIPVVKEQSNISWNSMNKGDVFILDAIKYVYLWSGKTANHMEKIQGAKISQQLKGENGPECKGIVIIDDGKELDDLHGDEKSVFEKYLPLDKKDAMIKEAIEDTVETRRKHENAIRLYRVSDESGSLKIEQIKTGPLSKDDLDSKDSFIVDNENSGVWAWIGKNANQKERVEAMRNAQGFIKEKNYPQHTSVTRVIDGGEPIEFKSLFKTWRDVNTQRGLGKTYSSGGKVVKLADLQRLMANNRLDVSKLHENSALAAQTQMVDDGTGKKKVYRIKSMDLIAIDENDYGNFFSGDCYIITYTYMLNNRENVLIYYWIGSNSTIDERGAVAIKTVEIDDKEYGGRGVQVRVTEGKEPPHFTSIFGGRMVIYKGGFKSGFRSQANIARDTEHGDRYLLHVRGTNKYVTRAVEVNCDASSLNSNDTFVLFTPATIFIWAGKGSTGDEREMARLIAQRDGGDGRDIVTVSEGQEKKDFWSAIGGEKPYHQEKSEDLSSTVDHKVRLFQCSNASGIFTVEEIVDFNQTDLVEDDVMLLDSYDTIFLWIGSKSNETERKAALEAAEEYLRTDPSERDLETPIVTIKQGNEPLNFSGFFGAWNNDLWKSINSSDIKSEIINSGKSSTLRLLNSSKVGSNAGADFVDVNSKYPLSLLRVKDPMELPEGVDPSNKEAYLSSEEFNSAFGMSYQEYQTLPKWKQIDLKKKVGLF